jgi:hypothetical protein
MFVEQDLGSSDLVCLQCSHRQVMSSELLSSYQERKRRYARWLEEQRAEKIPA